jgi:hypothetical protein
MAFTPQERVDLRRFCGYGQFGALAGQGFSYRFFQQYGNMEYRLTNSLPEEETTIRTNYLANLYVVETAVIAAQTNFDTESAAVWHHNQKEHRDRVRHYNWLRRELCGMLGIEPGPALSASDNTIELRV